MRRLDILLNGQSQAMTDLALELEQHGHSLTRISELDEMPGPVDLLIDDGTSLQFTAQAPRLTLQLGLGKPQTTGLPSLNL